MEGWRGLERKAINHFFKANLVDAVVSESGKTHCLSTDSVIVQHLQNRLTELGTSKICSTNYWYG